MVLNGHSRESGWAQGSGGASCQRIMHDLVASHALHASAVQEMQTGRTGTGSKPRRSTPSLASCQVVVLARG